MYIYLSRKLGCKPKAGVGANAASEARKRRGFQGEEGTGTPWDRDVFCIIFWVRFWITFLLAFGSLPATILGSSSALWVS